LATSLLPENEFAKFGGPQKYGTKIHHPPFFHVFSEKKSMAFEQVRCFFEVHIPEAPFLEQIVQALIRRPCDKKGHPGGVVLSYHFSLCDEATKSEVSS